MVSKSNLNPFFTIVTPTHNSASYLKSCLASVDNQTFRDFEHIIIDGNSVDKTTKILKKYKREFISKKALGIANAMNEGIRKAKGRYIYFLNSDDSLYSPTVLFDVAKYLNKHPQLDWVYGRIHEVREDGTTVGYPPRLPIFHTSNKTILKFYNYIPHQAVFMKKSVFEDLGSFDENLKSMMDDEYWLRVASKTKWKFIKCVIANYSIRPTSQSEMISNKLSNTLEYLSIQQKYLSKIEFAIAKIVNKIIR